jgi:diguanylate cyclase (GGDEF)-like protein
VCLIAYDRYGRPETFRVLLRDSADIVELAYAPWWNPRHTLWVLGIMMVCFAGAVSWVTVLRGQVRRQTLELRDANQALKRLSVEDPLTGIANRRKFDETLTIEFNRARESKTALSMLMVDIDYFKALNDEFGHQRGDQCLVEVVRALESASLRNTDLLARYGGEEFAVILPETGGAGAIAVAERMRLAVLSLDIPLACSPHNRRLSISLGVATMHPDTAALPSSLVAMADRALYQSKERGRNRTASLDGILEPGACPMVSGGGA